MSTDLFAIYKKCTKKENAEKKMIHSNLTKNHYCSKNLHTHILSSHCNENENIVYQLFQILFTRKINKTIFGAEPMLSKQIFFCVKQSILQKLSLILRCVVFEAFNKEGNSLRVEVIKNEVGQNPVGVSSYIRIELGKPCSFFFWERW